MINAKLLDLLSILFQNAVIGLKAQLLELCFILTERVLHASLNMIEIYVQLIAHYVRTVFQSSLTVHTSSVEYVHIREPNMIFNVLWVLEEFLFSPGVVGTFIDHENTFLPERLF
jgi:hypothetical protein